VNGTDIYAGTCGGGVFLSTNNGTSWVQRNTGLTNDSITSFAVNGSNIFAATFDGKVFLSTNNGANWTGAYSGLPGNSRDVRAFTVSGANIFAGIEFGGVYLSTNNGSSWTAVNNGIPLDSSSNTGTLSLTTDGTKIFAGTIKQGVFLSTNNGASWTSENTDLGYTNGIYSLAIIGTNIFAGGLGSGIWKRPLSEMGIEQINNTENNIAIYPSPATDNLTIESLQKLEIEILNIQGQIILQQSIPQGKTDIDISGLAKGIYILRLKSNDKSTLTKIIKE
jgi:hypothetical protein